MIAVDDIRTNDLETTWQSFYMALNKFITNKQNGMGKKEDKQIGQFFIDFNDTLIAESYSRSPDTALEKINRLIKNKLLIYLWQDVQGVNMMKSSVSLFAPAIGSYDDLYKKYGNDKVFSDEFIEGFLKPGLSDYPYDGGAL